MGVMNSSSQHQKGQKLPGSPNRTKQQLGGIKPRSVNPTRVKSKDKRELFELKDNTDERINRYKLTLNKCRLGVRRKFPTDEDTFTSVSQQKRAA